MQYIQNRIKENTNAQKKVNKKYFSKMENLQNWANWHHLFVICHATKIHEFSNEITNKNARNLKRNYFFIFRKVEFTELGQLASFVCHFLPWHKNP
jgi:hypothetical protein